MINSLRIVIAGKSSAFDSQYKISRKCRDHVPVRSQSYTKMFMCILIWFYFSCFRPAIFIFLCVCHVDVTVTRSPVILDGRKCFSLLSF